MRPKETFTPRMQEGMVRLATWMPFRQACRELEFFTGIQVSATTVRATAEQAGEAHVQGQDSQAASIQAECPASPPGPAVQLMSVDGAFIQLVGGEWKEVKTLALGVVGKPEEEDGERVVHTAELSYFSRMSEAKEFEKQALVEMHERGVEQAEVVCAVTDGAEWIQKFVDVHRHDAVRILDFAHAMEKVTEVGKTIEEQGLILACLDRKCEDKRAKRKKSRQTKKKQAGEPQQSNQTEPQLAAGQSKVRLEGWLDWQAEEVKKGEAVLVIQEIERLVTWMQEEGLAKAAQTMAKRLNYLKERQSMMAYATFGEQGYPIGSGSVESANKLVVESRMKGAGMRWGEEHVDPMLALRNVACSDRWRQAWKQIRRQWVQQSQAKRACKSAQRLLCQQDQQGSALPVQTLSDQVPSPSPIPPEPGGPLIKGAGLDSQTHEVLPTAEISSSAQLKQEGSTVKDRRPAPTHPWRRPFLRQRPAS
ncbi:MAG: hypothetical protein NVS4B9_16150 [Ktedonobacteraceae bacterium]